MRLRFACRTCEATVATGDIDLPAEIDRPACGARAKFSDLPAPGGPIQRCLACGGPHLFLQKEFPRRLGLALTVAGAASFLLLMGMDRIVSGFAVLLGVAMIDALLYRAGRLMTVCYHCQ